MQGAQVWEEWVNKEFTHTMRVRAGRASPRVPPRVPRPPAPARARRPALREGSAPSRHAWS